MSAIAHRHTWLSRAGVNWARHWEEYIYISRYRILDEEEMPRLVDEHGSRPLRVHNAAPCGRVPFATTANTSRVGLSPPYEPDALDAVWTRASRCVPFATTATTSQVGVSPFYEHDASVRVSFGTSARQT